MKGHDTDFIKLVGAASASCILRVFAFVLTGAAYAEDADKTAVSGAGASSQNRLTAKTVTACRRKDFMDIIQSRGSPGQQPEYLKNQLQAFVEHRRTNNIMFNVAHVLSPAMLDALATSFQNLNPKPLTSAAPKELVAAGKKIYEEGLPDSDVPPCASCHGPEAKGDGQFPRLAGQLSDYVFNKLTNWTKERGQNPAKPDPSAIMQPIAHSLSEQQIKAVAAYLNNQE